MVIKVVAFTVVDGKLLVFLNNGLLPQGELQENESLDTAAIRIFKKFLQILPKESYLEQLYTFSKARNIEVVYYILLPGYTLKSLANWYSLVRSHLARLDDRKITGYAIQRLQWKIEYTNVVYSLLPDRFTLSELQQTYEAILGNQLDKRNFRKKILSLKLLKDTGKKRTGTVARPASVYEFRKRSPVGVKVF